MNLHVLQKVNGWYVGKRSICRKKYNFEDPFVYPFVCVFVIRRVLGRLNMVLTFSPWRSSTVSDDQHL